MRLTVNACRDLARKRQRLPFDADGQTIVEERVTATVAGNPEAAMEAGERRQALRAALDTLPERERVAVILRDIEGYTAGEVAGILGTSEATVRSQASRGRVRLREALGRLKRERS
jgi:RNA polymerase sigma-70 factor (ECF subfamily)